MKVAFLVNDLQLSGGVGVVVQHARRLSAMEDWDVTLVLVRDAEGPSWHGYGHLPHLHVCSRLEAMADRYDIAVATWWETAFSLFEISAERHVYFVQSLEDRFYHHTQVEQLAAAMTLDLPVAFITEAQWIVDTLADLRPDAPCYLVRNGIDKETFAPLAEVAPSQGPLRVLIEGSPYVWFKHVPEAVQAAAAMLEPHRVTVVASDLRGGTELAADEVVGPLSQREMAELYASNDVLLKLSSVEGVSGPPLEAFHRGATCVVTPVTGHDEYVEHGVNGLLTDWDDLRGTARHLDLLARDRALLHFLRTNALETARAWPSWEESSQQMAAALLAIREEPQPGGPVASARLLADLCGGVETYNASLGHHMDIVQQALLLQHRVNRVRGSKWARPLRPVTRPVSRLVRRAAS